MSHWTRLFFFKMAGTLEDFIQRPEDYNMKRDNYEEHIYV